MGPTVQSNTAKLALNEVAKHNTANSLWIVIDSVVYDVTKFASVHPGGLSVLLDVAGRDATQEFYNLHRQDDLEKYKRLLRVGVLEGTTPGTSGSSESLDLRRTVPYAEPTWLTEGFYSPYYSESHRRFQRAVRKFVGKVVFPDAQKCEADGKPPSASVFAEMGRKNIIAMRMGPGKHLKGRVLMDGIVKPEEFDQFHEVILWQEWAYIHARGYSDGCGGGTCIGLPPVLNFGGKKLKDAIVEDVLAGRKFMALAVTEAFAGSDVAGIRSSAERKQGGWILNGTKKWITNGTFADYFTVACRNKSTGEIMVLIAPRGAGVSTSLIHTSYSTAAGTAYVTFENVFVPTDFVITEKDGLRIILSNFNRERWILTMSSISWQRAIVEECLKWVSQRFVFGKPLSSQGVVRSKLAAMISRVESCQHWLENITYQMTRMSYAKQANELAGQIAFFKMHSTRAAQDTARDAVQIFGGRGLTQSGMGKYIEHYHRTLLIDSIGGGAEDILADLGVKQALRKMPKTARL